VIIDVPAELPSALGVLPADAGCEIQLVAEHTPSRRNRRRLQAGE